MEFENSAWLGASYVQTILRKAETDESIEVSGITINPATAIGDNYSSDIYRVRAVFSRVLKGKTITETKSLIVKVAPQGGARDEWVSSSQFFETEMSMISETLPLMNQILAKIDKAPLAARCLHVQHERPVHIIMEDLTPKGFRMVDRQSGLDLDHCLLAFRNLAAFHASSIALLEENPEAVTERYNNGIYHKDPNEGLAVIFKSGTRILGKQVAKWPELNPRISEKLLALADCIYEKGSQATIFREGDFNILNHGDCWANNMLFRYNEQGKPIEHIFVDFQVSHYGSPATDILFFLGTSHPVDIRLEHRETLMHEYHTSLTSIMHKLECKTTTPTFEDLQKILRKRYLCEVIPSLALLPLVLVDKSEVKSFDEILPQDRKECENPAFQGKQFKKIIIQLLPLYDSMGLLDV